MFFCAHCANLTGAKVSFSGRFGNCDRCKKLADTFGIIEFTEPEAHPETFPAEEVESEIKPLTTKQKRILADKYED